VILCAFCSYCAFGGALRWVKEEDIEPCQGDQECFSRYPIDYRSSCRLYFILTMISLFSHDYVFLFAFYTLIVQFVLDPRRIEEEKEEMEPCISIQSSCVRIWVSGRVFGYLFIWLC
jgi:hypothetical protein